MDINAIIAAKKFCRGGGGGSVPKPLTYDYMPEGYPKIDREAVTIFDQTVEGFEDDGGEYCAELPEGAFELIVGEKYVVVLDGVEYSDLIAADQDGTVFIGADPMEGVTATLPFYITLNSEFGCWFYTKPDATSHTISIAHISEVVTPMDSRFVSGGGVKYCTFATVDGVTYTVSMTYQEIKEAMLSGSVVLGVDSGYVFNVVQAPFLSDIATFDLVEEVIFANHYIKSGFGVSDNEVRWIDLLES